MQCARLTWPTNHWPTTQFLCPASLMKSKLYFKAVRTYAYHLLNKFALYLCCLSPPLLCHQVNFFANQFCFSTFLFYLVECASNVSPQKPILNLPFSKKLNTFRNVDYELTCGSALCFLYRTENSLSLTSDNCLDQGNILPFLFLKINCEHLSVE